MAAINMPPLPVPQHRFIEYVAANPSTPITELLQPFKQYEDELRKVFAQQPEHAVTKQLNIVPMYKGHEKDVKIRARALDAEPDSLKETYIMPLKPSERKPNDSLAIAESLQHFKTNFNLFTESSLTDLRWDNVVVAGSAVVTSLLSVPEQYAHTKRDLRRYYHEIVAPASDVDLFLYDLTEAQAIEKIKQIEKNVRDALLVETTTIRTKNTITIVSQYPVRHVQIVLRIYKSISEILTGFDVDCSCGAYDGKQVWASPRAIAAYMTQTNTLDLTRRSPSYENRLSKYRHRGFEVRFPELDRSRIDPTIYERSFYRTQGLARLLILEKLPKSSEREAYIDQRRLERGRPEADRSRMKQHLSRGNIKSKWEDEVAEWVDADELSSYHTFTIPYGPKYHARKIEKLLYTKDLLLNAEWNKPKDREVNLHRHPAFFGSVNDVIDDCCGHCPSAITIEEEEVAEQESKTYVAGPVTFMKDDCGRQAIGSFNPLSPDEYTDMAYVGNTELLCQAIIDLDLAYVESWLSQIGNNPNTRDHTGRCPLHLAVSYSSIEIVQCLIDHGARLIARLVDGKTALHLACLRGDPLFVSALLRKSEANEEVEMQKTDAKRKLRVAANAANTPASSTEGATFEMVDMSEVTEADSDAMTDGSIVHVKSKGPKPEEELDNEDDNSPDVYDVNVLTWDTPTSPLHLAILSGHEAAAEYIVQDFGANILLPVILPAEYTGGPSAGALLTLTLAFSLPLDEAKGMTRLLFKLGASSAQADSKQKTALEYCISNQPQLLDTYLTSDPVGVTRALKHVAVQGHSWSPIVSSPLLLAISHQDVETAVRLLSAGAKPDVPFEAFLKGIEKTASRSMFDTSVEQPIVCAIERELPVLAETMIEQYGVDSNTLTKQGWKYVHESFGRRERGRTLLDFVNDNIQHLRDWKHEATTCDPPIPIADDRSYLSGSNKGTYQYWSALEQLERAKSRYQKEWQQHLGQLSRIAHNDVGLEQKQAAIYDKLDEFRKLQVTLHAHSAKTFKELYPQIEEHEDTNNGYNHGLRFRAKNEPFKVVFCFNVAIPNDEVRERYIRLFEAAWKADVKTIKELTMLAWKSADGERRPPLQIAVKDHQRHSPFSIAVFQGHYNVAKMVLDIAAAQYTPPDPPKKRRYHVATGDDSEDDANASDDAGDELPISSEGIDDTLTIEDVGEVSLSVKSEVKPEEMLFWNIPNGAEYEWTNAPGVPNNLIEHALAQGDMHLLSLILDLSEKYTGQADTINIKDSRGRDKSYRHSHFARVLEFGPPHMLAELIKRTAIGLSIDDLAVEHGVGETTTEPKYYQGLSVNGKKRKDWADAGRDSAGMEEFGPQMPPLLMAAYNGTLEQVEWLLSDAPLRYYKHFAEAHKDDKRLQKISRSIGGLESTINDFLHSRSHLAIHCCLSRRDQSPATLGMLKYLIEALPDALEARTSDQLTPLLRAFRLHNLEAANILINAGADQTARDGEGMNLLHQIMRHNFNTHEHLAHIRSMIGTIDKRLIPSMCIERTSAGPGALTPLALWLTRVYGTKEHQTGVTRLILEYSGGVELATLNGEGQTVLHTVARMSSNDSWPHGNNHHWLPQLADIFLDHRPDLVTWENATGKTSLELVEDSILAMKCSGHPDRGISTRRRRRRRYGVDDGNRSITDVPPRDFIEQSDSSDPESDEQQQGLSPMQMCEQVRDLLIATQAKLDAEGRGKRRLVTLNEASEVARRLAAVQRKKVEAEDEHAVKKRGGRAIDEFERWVNGAFRRSGPVA